MPAEPPSLLRLVPLLFVVLGAPLRAQGDVRPVDYLREVRPILAQHCYRCHGPDAADRQADLRLDRPPAPHDATAKGPTVIVAGKPEQSELILRLKSADDETRMPPPERDDALTAKEVETIERWIAEGAVWPEHWSFRPILRPEPPAVRDAAWVRNPIDRFVLAHLEAAGLGPAPEAPRAQGLRRLSFDLTGLPPTIEEIEDFSRDESPEAWSRVVHRLIESPRRGEHMAAGWLDLARYADTNGYQGDGPRENWPWRDWVIRAFNSKMPFDRFTIEQLAGDLLPSPTLEQRVATGFNRNNPTNSLAGFEEDEYRSEYVIDRVHTTATTWLGLTLSCAQCHDHKFDPLTQKDFYSFFAFFNQVKERDISGRGRNTRPTLAVPGPDDAPKLEDVQNRRSALLARLDRPDPLSDRAQRAWEERALRSIGAPYRWQDLVPEGLLARQGTTLTALPDHSIRASGDTPVRDTYDLLFKPGRKTIQALRIEVLPDPEAPGGASGRADDGRFVLSRIEVRASNLSESRDPPLVFFSRSQADVVQTDVDDPEELDFDLFEATPSDVDGAVPVSDDPKEDAGGLRGFGMGWCLVGEAMKESHEAILVPLEPVALNESSLLKISLVHAGRPMFKAQLARFRISCCEEPRVRDAVLPTAAGHWSTLGPFPARDLQSAWATAFEPEAGIRDSVDRARRFKQPVLPPTEAQTPAKEKKGPPKQPDGAAEKKPSAPTEPGAEAAAKEGPAKPEAVLAAEPKPAPRPEPKPEAKPEPKEPQRLGWEERSDWRDGRSRNLDGGEGDHAWYLVRKVENKGERTAILRLDGPLGVKVWLNGEPIFAEAPRSPPAATEKKDKTDAKPPEGADEAEADDEVFPDDRPDLRGSRGERLVRIGLRAGSNEIVVKAVFSAPPAAEKGEKAGPPGGFMRRGRGGAAAITFDLLPEGDDRLDWEVIGVLRRRDLAAARDELAGLMRGPLPPRTSSDRLDRRLAMEASRLRRFYRRQIDPVGRVLADEFEKVTDERRRLLRRIPESMVMEDRRNRRRTWIYRRGDFRKKGAEVTADTPSFLPPMGDDQPRDRLGLARWIVSRDNPLTARVVVNRLWRDFFGQGLVTSGDDFGIRSEAPTHPELLDWLAAELIESGWDLAHLQELIVTSATYRQGRPAEPGKTSADPEGRLLAGLPRRRLAAEMVRDQALAVSGLLVEKIGGPSVKPYQPEGLWKAVDGSRDWKKDRGEKVYRRALYVYWKRGVPYPSMSLFDAAKRETCAASRVETTTPLQSLVLLNDPVYVEAARVFGQRMRKEGGRTDPARLAWGFRSCTGRLPEDAELTVLGDLLTRERELFAKDLDAAKKLVALGDAPLPREAAPEELAAWTAVAQALFNLDETIHR